MRFDCISSRPGSRRVAGAGSVRLVRWGLLLAIPVFCGSVGALPRELQTGRAGHAFDHLGGIGEQAETAAACGANILYVTGLGGVGYGGLPSPAELSALQQHTAEYLKRARRHGIRLALGYMCATSLVNLETFDRHWPPELRAQFRTPPSQWRQQDRQGRPLPSWYGGAYQPACMNHPDWRAYQRFIVRLQIAAGCDGIFFDNPTVHPQGCFCRYCMAAFARFLRREGQRAPERRDPTRNDPDAESFSLEALRTLAVTRSNDFLRFRCTIAREFLAEMRRFARTVRPAALITANNSLNAPEVLYLQCRTYAYSPYEMSKVEDFVVVEDMASQPRALANGQTREYGPTYRQLHALCHGKPIVAVTLADADYHTPPNLVRLAMAEAAAHDASYLLWPTWPEAHRARMTAAIRPQADLLREHSPLLHGARARRDVVLFLPMRRWLETNRCTASEMAAALTRANVQFEVACEDTLGDVLAARSSARSALTAGTAAGSGPLPTKVLLAEARSVFNSSELGAVDRFVGAGGALVTAERPDWLERARAAVGSPSITLQAPATVRAVVRDAGRATVVHLLNLNVQKLSSFEDKVTPATDVHVTCRVPFARVRRVRALTADDAASRGALPFTAVGSGDQTVVKVVVPALQVATMLVIE